MNEKISKIFDSPNKKIYEGEHGILTVHGKLNIDLIARYLLELKQKV